MRTCKTFLCVMSLMVLSACTPDSRAETDASADSISDPQAGSAQTTALAPDAGVSQPSAGDTTVLRWSFESVTVGDLPPGWTAERTNPRQQEATWSVQRDHAASSADNILALTDTGDSRGSTYNLAWTNQVSFLDGTVQVKVKAGTGREDQGGGPIWRVRDADNYYIARWNPLEDNTRLYYVRDGKRTMLESAQTKLPIDEWHTIAIRHHGDQIEVLVDGQQVLQATDDTFQTTGGVGVWTKADAATSFDDLVVSAR